MPVHGLDGIVCMPLPTPFMVGSINVYLIEDEPLTLVDTGPDWPDALSMLEQGLAERGHTIEDLGLILLTHQHVDHVGLGYTLKRRSGAELAAAAPAARHMESYECSVAGEDAYQVAVMRRYGLPEHRIRENAAISRRYWRYGRSVEVDRILGAGDEVRLANRTLNVLMRPGHSPADTVFAFADRRAAFVGDHVLRKISPNPLIHRPLSGSDDPADRDSPLITYLDSLRNTRDDGFGTLLGGHGDPIDDPDRLIERRLADHERRKVRILNIIRNGGRRAEDIMAALWPHLGSSATFLALSEALGHTDLLISEGVLAEAGKRGAITFEPV